MSFRVPGLQTVQVIRRVRQKTEDDTAWARDDRGDAVYADVTTDISGCSIQPGVSIEDANGERDQVSTFVTIYAPSSWPGEAIDAVLIDGTRYQIVGKPQRWNHPRLAHVVVTVSEVTG